MDDILTITCKYSCKECGLEKISVDVPARQHTEEVTAWMEQTIRHVALDHHRRSPRCFPKELTNLIIPMTGTTMIGGPTVQ